MQCMTGVNEPMVEPSGWHEVEYEIPDDEKMDQPGSVPPPAATQRMINNNCEEVAPPKDDVVVLFDNPSVKKDLKKQDRKRSERRRKDEKKNKGSKSLLGREKGESTKQRKSKSRLHGNSGRSKRRSKSSTRSSSTREKYDLKGVIAPTKDHDALPVTSTYSAERFDPEVSKPPSAMPVEDSPNIGQNRILSAMLDEKKLHGNDTITFHYVPPDEKSKGNASESVTIKYKGGPKPGLKEADASKVTYVAPSSSSDKPSLLGCTIVPPKGSDRKLYGGSDRSDKSQPVTKNGIPALDQAKPVVSPSTTFDETTKTESPEAKPDEPMEIVSPESKPDDSMPILGSTATFDDSWPKMGVAAKRAAAKRKLMKTMDEAEKVDGAATAPWFAEVQVPDSMGASPSQEATSQPSPSAVDAALPSNATAESPLPPASTTTMVPMKRNREPTVENPLQALDSLPPPMIPPSTVTQATIAAIAPDGLVPSSTCNGVMDGTIAAPSPAPGILPTATAAVSQADNASEPTHLTQQLADPQVVGLSIPDGNPGSDMRAAVVPTVGEVPDLQIENSPSDDYPEDSPYQRKVTVDETDSKPPSTLRGRKSSVRSAVGLSELSKQLRILQGKNQSQSVEIDRLERQLAILADLKGINVAELRRALEEACEAEAHDELQRRVAALRVQLEVATGRGKEGAESGSSTMAVAKQPSFDEEATSQRIANLQLRIGELEETEDALRLEMNGLYTRLRDQSSEASRLMAMSKLQEANIELQRQEIDLYKQRITFLENELMHREEEEKKKTAMVPYEAPSDLALPGQQEDLAIVPFEEPQLNLVFEFQAQKAVAEEAKKEKHQVVSQLQKKEVELQVQQDRVKVLEGQVLARTKDFHLKKDQYRARFQMQDERLRDLEQQLSSLYKAFDLLKEEREAEDVTRLALNQNLYEADNKVAIQMDELQEASDGPRSSVVQGSPIPTRRRPASIMSRGSSGSSRPNPSPNPSWGAIAGGLEPVIRGFLWKRGSDLFRQWKKRYFSLYDHNGSHQLHYTEGQRREMRGTLCYLTKGVTTVTATGNEFPKHPHAFVIRLNPADPQAPVICAAAASKEAFDLWMTALTVATLGDVKSQSIQSKSPTPFRDNLDPSVASSRARSAMTTEEQEAADHELALQMQYGD